MSPQPLRLMTSDPDWLLLARCLRGECTADEAAAIARWEAEEPEHARVLALMRRVWDEAAAEVPEADEDAGWQALQERLAAVARRPGAARTLRLVPDRGSSSRRRWIAAVAAAAAAVVGVVGVGLLRSGEPTLPAQPAREYATERGQRAEVMLVDGTRVWLSVESRLRVPEGYGTRTRDVELDGEAYFVVEANPKLPFRVHTRGAVSEDLGTEFSVRAYPDDHEVVVAVASGRVLVRPEEQSGPRASVSSHAPAGSGSPMQGTPPRGEAAPGAPVQLARGQLGRVDAAGRVTVTDHVDFAETFGWREGRLRFVERPLREVVRELERWYDLEITLDDPALANVPVTASLGRRNADQALAIVAGVLDAQYTREGRRVRLAPIPSGW